MEVPQRQSRGSSISVPHGIYAHNCITRPNDQQRVLSFINLYVRLFFYFLVISVLQLIGLMFNFAYCTSWVARFIGALATWVLPSTHNINVLYIFIHSFIYSPNAIKTKHNKITQLGMTTRQRICTYRSHKIIIK